MVSEDQRLASARSLVTRITALVHELDETLNAPAVPPTPETPQPPKRPGPDNTGVPAGTSALTPSGTVTTTHDGQVIDHLDIAGMVKVQHHNVTIGRCRITAKPDAAPSDYPIKVAAGVTGTVIEDCEIDGNGRTSLCVGFKGYTLRRCNVHGAAGDLLRADGNTVVEDSWLHDIVRVPGGHHDAIQTLKGSGIILLRNNIDIAVPYPDGTGTDPLNACYIISAQAPVNDVLIEGNWLNGGNYTLYLGGPRNSSSVLAGPPVVVTGVTVRGNTFGPAARYGPITAKGDALIEGNQDDTGKAI